VIRREKTELLQKEGAVYAEQMRSAKQRMNTFWPIHRLRSGTAQWFRCVYQTEHQRQQIPDPPHRRSADDASAITRRDQFWRCALAVAGSQHFGAGCRLGCWRRGLSGWPELGSTVAAESFQSPGA